MSKGRQTRDGATVRRVQVMLDEETVERAKKLGAGNISAGIRKASSSQAKLMLLPVAPARPVRPMRWT